MPFFICFIFFMTLLAFVYSIVRLELVHQENILSLVRTRTANARCVHPSTCFNTQMSFVTVFCCFSFEQIRTVLFFFVRCLWCPFLIKYVINVFSLSAILWKGCVFMVWIIRISQRCTKTLHQVVKLLANDGKQQIWN